jgi:hypothetical protein
MYTITIGDDNKNFDVEVAMAKTCPPVEVANLLTLPESGYVWCWNGNTAVWHKIVRNGRVL